MNRTPLQLIDARRKKELGKLGGIRKDKTRTPPPTPTHWPRTK